MKDLCDSLQSASGLDTSPELEFGKPDPSDPADSGYRNLMNRVTEYTGWSRASPIYEQDDMTDFLDQSHQKDLVLVFHKALQKKFACKLYNVFIVECLPWLVVTTVINFSSVFDTFSHAILLNCLRDNLGTTGQALAWLTSCLSDRPSQVQLGSFLSAIFFSTCVVPQRSNLSPWLTKLYLALLAHRIAALCPNLQCYADDTRLIFWLPLLSLSAIQEWCAANGLCLNASKTEIFLIGTPTPSFPVVLLALLLPFEAKNLGVIFDSTLSFSPHISDASKKSHYQLHLLRGILPFLSFPQKLTVSRALVLCRLDYCNNLFLNLPALTLCPLQLIHNRTARLVLGLEPRHRISPGLKSLHWLPVAARIKFKTLCIVHNAFWGPNTFNSLFLNIFPLKLFAYLPPTPSESVASSSKELVVDLSSAGASLWNTLPASVKLEENHLRFRKHSKTFLFASAFSPHLLTPWQKLNLH
ncbi:uncharacterized protein [Ambystoma mexicanum]|uniref:uncharacterized protein n=1 Tax=Ambystoma mexicanum TaxID=8296 RepID=UPI0037E7BD2B